MRWLAVLALPQLTSHGYCHLGISRSQLVDGHLTELEHLAEHRAVFPYIKNLHLLHHLVLQKRTGQGVTTLIYAQGYSFDEADEAAASASDQTLLSGVTFCRNSI